MEQSNPKFRLRLNLFDGLILVLVLVVGGALVWFGLRSDGGSGQESAAGTVRYTILIQRMAQGDSELIQPGDQLEETVENHRLGTVVSVRAEPALAQVLDQENRCYVQTQLEGYEDVYITVESACTQQEAAPLLAGGEDIRVGQALPAAGPAHLSSGRATHVRRGVPAGAREARTDRCTEHH